MPFVLALLLSFSSAQAVPPCGNTGSLAERAADCEEHTRHSNLPSGWRWVTLAPDREVSQDTRTGLLWTRRSRGISLYSLAANSCAEFSLGDDTPPFEIPTVDEVRIAFDGGLSSALDLPWEQIWTSTLGKNPGEHWAFDLWGGAATLLRLPTHKNVLPRLLSVCVARPAAQSPRPASISAGVR